MDNEKIFYQAMRRQGATQRSFPKYRSLATTSLGLGAGTAPKIAWALENKPRIPAVWIHDLECVCRTGLFIRSVHPLTKGIILFLISLNYDNTLVAVAGTQAGEVFEDVITRYNGKYILAVENNPPLGEQGVLCISSGRPFIERLKRVAAGASAIIAWGTCAPRGRIQAVRPNSTRATPIDKVITDKPITKVSGCPPTSDMMSAIITYIVTLDRLSDVDKTGRPLMFYGQRVRDKYRRRAHFDTGESVQSRDDDTAHKGYCLYRMDCKGLTTYSACPSAHWNDGVSSPIQPGHGCLSCAENGFWNRGSFYSRVVDIPQTGTHSTTDTVGSAALGIVAVAVSVHVTASVVDQRRHHNQQLTGTEHQPGNKDKQA